MLTDWGYKYDISSNGNTAVENLKTTRYDLILMDIQMPELNGYQATEYIRKTLKLGLPIIAMSAHTMPGEQENCQSAGMTDYISKPINEVELFNMITKHLISSDFLKTPAMANVNKKINTVTNLDYLMDLSKGNTQFVKEMIDTFLEENPKEVLSLENAIQSRDFESIRQAAHLLLSSIQFVGLDKLIGDDVYEIEKLALNKALLEKIQHLFSKIKVICERSRSELNGVSITSA